MKIKILILIIIVGLLITNIADALTISSVSSNPKEVRPGEKVSLDLTIKNNLDDDVTNVKVSLDLINVPFSPYQSSSQINFNEIKEDKSKIAEFELITNSNAESGTYKIPVKISYILNNIEKESSGLVGLIVNALPKLEVSSDSILIKGKTNDLSIKLTNFGLGEAKLLSLRLNPGTGIKILGSDSSYLGNIESDDFDSADFRVSVNENVPAIVNMQVELRYQDSRNNEIVETKTLPIRTYTEKEAARLGLIKNSNFWVYVLGIVVLVVVILIYRWIKRRARKKKLEAD